jgi:hypothetical protein
MDAFVIATGNLIGVFVAAWLSARAARARWQAAGAAMKLGIVAAPDVKTEFQPSGSAHGVRTASAISKALALVASSRLCLSGRASRLQTQPN